MGLDSPPFKRIEAPRKRIDSLVLLEKIQRVSQILVIVPVLTYVLITLSTVVSTVSIMMSDVFQFRNDSKQHQFVEDSNFSTHSDSEIDFEANTVDVKQDLPGQTDYLDTVLVRDALGNERFCRSPSLRAPSDIEDDDSEEESRKAIAEKYSSANSDENTIISSQPSKEVEDEIDKLTGEFRNCIMKTIYSDSGVLRDGTTRLEKGVKLTITMAVRHRSVSSSGFNHLSLDKGSKPFALDRSNSIFEWGNGDKSMVIETSQDDFGQSKLPLPPRLKQVSHRNPLRLTRSLSSTSRDSIGMTSVSSYEQIFSHTESWRKSLPSALAKKVKMHKEISVKVWRSTVRMIRRYTKIKIVRHYPSIPSDPDCRYSAMV